MIIIMMITTMSMASLTVTPIRTLMDTSTTQAAHAWESPPS